MSSSFVPNEETDYIPVNILLTGGAGAFATERCGSGEWRGVVLSRRLRPRSPEFTGRMRDRKI
jgi:hypothetical protein